MIDYDGDVHAAKQAATDFLMRTTDKPIASDELARVLDILNDAWGSLTDCLVRQRKERDAEISRLLNELAEAKR